MSEKTRVAVCVTTYRRPEGLWRLLAGLSRLTFNKSESPDVEIIVVDNDPAGSARGCCERMRSDLCWPLKYSIEPRSGVSYARNRAIACTGKSTDFVAFVDDDEVPDPSWLDELLYAQQVYVADVISGPVVPYFDGPVPAWVTRGRFFERPRHLTGHHMKVTRTGNVLIRTKLFSEMKTLFDERFALTGGEDTHFFMRVSAAGFVMVWADDAVVHEWVPGSRANARWILERAYRGGTIFGRCVMELEPEAWRMRVAKAVGRIAQGLMLAVLSFVAGRHLLVEGLRRICASSGMLAALGGALRGKRQRVVANQDISETQIRGTLRPKVAVVYKSLPQWRRHFFELLKDRLDGLGVEFVLIYGQPGSADAAKKDTAELPWAYKIENKILRFRSREVYWQPCLGLLKDVDLVIVEQASKLLVNYVLLAQHLLGLRRLAFWGHGKNFQAHGGNRVSETVKRFISRRVHWWFAYNELSAGVVKDLGFPEKRITSVQNAIDTRELAEAKYKVSPEAIERLKEDLRLKGENVCIYAGGMYAEKRLRFLLESCELVRERISDFEMIFMGSGTDKALVEEAARRHDWVRYVGPKFDEEKVPYFMLSKLFLMPGLVGLAVLDAFSLEVPLMTTAVPYHSPEIEYLEDGINGVIVEETEDPAAFASAVVRLLEDEDLWARLVDGCRISKDKYAIEEMVERFAAGVLTALRQER